MGNAESSDLRDPLWFVEGMNTIIVYQQFSESAWHLSAAGRSLWRLKLEYRWTSTSGFANYVFFSQLTACCASPGLQLRDGHA